jgi:hypothetical protein
MGGLRFKLPPGGDVPPVTAARRMGLTLEAFSDALPALVARGFPSADATTGNYDLDAIDVWRRTRYPKLFFDAAHLEPSRDAERIVAQRLATARMQERLDAFRRGDFDKKPRGAQPPEATPNSTDNGAKLVADPRRGPNAPPIRIHPKVGPRNV